MKPSNKILFIHAAILFFILLSSAGPAFHQLEKSDTILISEEEEVGRWRISVDITNLDDSQYRGSLKIYVVEPISRWNDYNDEPYHFGFLDFAFEGEIEVSDTLTKNIFWNPTWKSTWDVDKDNLMVIAVLFNEHSEIRYSIPDTQQNEFNAYFSDATAAATPDTTGYNKVNNEFTHTVFVEKGTVTWCPACPRISELLYTIYSSNDYPFYFVSMVADKNSVAMNRLSNDFSMYYVPTTYFDGGYIVQIGGVEYTHRSHIESCGQKEVPQLNLSVSLSWDLDKNPPSISITKPESGLYIMNEKKRDMEQTIIVGTINIEADAYDDESGISKVEFYVNGELRSETGSYPYRFNNWKEDRFFGRYTIQAIAYDKAGNENMDEIQVIRFF